MSTLNWQGLAETRFRKYKRLVNRQSPGICGSYCAAVLIHDRVLQDTGRNLNQQQLVDGFKQVIDDYHLHRGTFIWNIQTGLNLMLAETPYRSKGGLFPERKLPALIDAGSGPIIVGTLGVLGSKYGNHWVLVYAYAYDADGNLFYRCYDNHGRHDAVISAREAFAHVYLVADKPAAAETEPTPAELLAVTAQTISPGVTFQPNHERTKALLLERLAAEKLAAQQFLGKDRSQWEDIILRAIQISIPGARLPATLYKLARKR